MRSRILLALVLVAALLGASVVGQAHAAPATNTAVQATPGVPPITCETVSTCEIRFYGNGSLQGYLMARRFDRPGFWLRLTRVAGWDNTYAAPITCATEDSCVFDYYSPGRYWMAKFAEGGLKWVRLTENPGIATKTPATPSAAVEGASGWRFRTGHICVLDKTAGRIPGGLTQATTAWSKAPELNLTVSGTCTGYPTSQVITTTAYTRTYGDCQQAKVWTASGYLQPGRINRAELAINTECGETALAFGLVLGLKRADSNDYGTVMGAAGLPTARDYQTVSRIYPGVSA